MRRVSLLKRELLALGTTRGTTTSTTISICLNRGKTKGIYALLVPSTNEGAHHSSSFVNRTTRCLFLFVLNVKLKAPRVERRP